MTLPVAETAAPTRPSVMVTHEPDSAAHADRVATLRDGVISSDAQQRRRPASAAAGAPARVPA